MVLGSERIRSVCASSFKQMSEVHVKAQQGNRRALVDFVIGSAFFNFKKKGLENQEAIDCVIVLYDGVDIKTKVKNG